LCPAGPPFFLFEPVPCGQDVTVPPTNAPTGPQTLWLVRHAQSQGNLADLKAQEAGADTLDLDIRDPDVELSDLGKRQSAALGKWLAGQPAGERPDAVLCSPYTRAASTAEIAIREARLDLEPVRDERLRERDLGAFDGFTGQGIRAKFPEESTRRNRLGKFYYRPPSGESWADVAFRVRGVSEMLEQRYAQQRVLVVTHQAVAMLFRYVLESLTEAEVLEIDAKEQIANAAVTRYELQDGRLTLQAFNDVEHLEEFDEPVTEEPDATAVSG
jgi:2,3-bisphosphoglycerate-dependent phosphoglycerate mutase